MRNTTTSIRDLTGVDIRPTREFPIDPANPAGFDNSGESLAMSPALMTKYLQAAREVASHLVLKPKGFAFAPHPMLVETDRDKYCVGQIVDFYHQQDTDYADYFQTAWRFKHRDALGKQEAKLADFAAEAKSVRNTWRRFGRCSKTRRKKSVRPRNCNRCGENCRRPAAISPKPPKRLRADARLCR